MEAREVRSVTRLMLPGLGFTLICLGAYLTSLSEWNDSTPKVLLAYTLISGGILLLLIGVFWTICHCMRSKRQRGGTTRRRRRRRRRLSNTEVCIYTIDRPSYFPPSYTESQQNPFPLPLDLPSGVCVDEGLPGNLQAPPLYTLCSTETPDASFSSERPPPYSETDPRSRVGRQGRADDPSH